MLGYNGPVGTYMGKRKSSESIILIVPWYRALYQGNSERRKKKRKRED